MEYIVSSTVTTAITLGINFLNYNFEDDDYFGDSNNNNNHSSDDKCILIRKIYNQSNGGIVSDGDGGSTNGKPSDSACKKIVEGLELNAMIAY